MLPIGFENQYILHYTYLEVMKLSNNNRISDLDKKISENITKIKNQLGLTTSDLATALDVDDSFIRNIESFNKKYNVKHLFILKEFLNKNNNSLKKYEQGITWDHIFPQYNDTLIVSKGERNVK